MFTISKWALMYSQPIFFVAMRMIFAGIILYAYCFIQKIKKPSEKKNYQIKLQDFWLFAQIVIFHIYLTYVFDLYALKDITSIESAFLYNFSPFISAFFSYIFFAESMTLKKWIGLLLGFCALLPQIIPGILQQTEIVTLKAKLITIAAVITSAYGWIILRILVKEKNYSIIFVNGFGMFVGGILALFTSLFTEVWTPSPVTQWLPFLQSTVLIIFVSNILFYNLYGYLLKFYTATFLSFAGFLCPIFAAVLGWFCLCETISFSFIISCLVITFGLYLFYHEELRQGYIKDQEVL